jgi:hypothetical protein
VNRLTGWWPVDPIRFQYLLQSSHLGRNKIKLRLICRAFIFSGRLLVDGRQAVGARLTHGFQYFLQCFNFCHHCTQEDFLHNLILFILNPKIVRECSIVAKCVFLGILHLLSSVCRTHIIMADLVMADLVMQFVQFVQSVQSVQSV